MNYARQFAMSKFSTKEDREAAINAKIDAVAKKRDYAADTMGNVMLSWTYQQDIDRLVELLTPNVALTGAEGVRVEGAAIRKE